MQTLILPGYSSSNKEWVDEVATNLNVEGIMLPTDVIRPFYWMHWTDEAQKFNTTEKAELIAKHIRGDKVNIIAKSIGTLVASLVYQIVPNQINKLIFCGIPVNTLEENEIHIIKNCISSNSDRFIGFQNSYDPLGGFEKVKDFGNIKMTERNDHDYPFFEEFNNFIKVT